ncbi:MAG: response regulator transcription factor [Deltaproteobacteria bacterium]|nr:response regulator transcription factor [Deltaproteobacteria bacterium]
MRAKSGTRSACLHLMAPSRTGSPDASGRERSSKRGSMTKELVARMLTAREIEVLELLSQGRRTRDVASLLSVSIATVRNHIEHIHAKLGVHRRIDAVLLWLSSP